MILIIVCYMLRTFTAFLLILMMLVMPIASAIEHCMGMSMHEDSMAMDNTNTFAVFVQETLDDSQLYDGNICQDSDLCSYHACGGLGIITSSQILLSSSTFTFNRQDISFSYPSPIFHSIKPPISIL